MSADKKQQRKAFYAMRATIGKNLHTVRSERRMSLQKCAQRSGVNPLRIDFYEMGKGDISLSVLIRLAGALDIPPEQLMEDKQ